VVTDYNRRSDWAFSFNTDLYTTKRFKDYPINRVSSGLQVFGFFGCEAYQRRTVRAGVVPHQPRSSLANAHRISCASNSDFLIRQEKSSISRIFSPGAREQTSKLGSAFKFPIIAIDI